MLRPSGSPSVERLGPRVLHFAATARFAAAAFLVFCAVVLGAATGCQKQELTPEQARLRKGSTLYTLHCASCHNADPRRDGALGPAIAGSSVELLEARVQRGEYPEGYTPKRSTQIMRRLPMTPGDLEALHAYLDSL